MTAGPAGTPSPTTPTAFRFFYLPLLVAGLNVTACVEMGPPLTPAWQQDANLYHHGVASRPGQTSTTPHLVARVIYAAPSEVQSLMQQQGDPADAQRGLARFGDGTLDVGLQDAATGRWLDAWQCGGALYVAGLPNQAYRIVIKNRTPMPLDLAVSVDGKDAQSGAASTLKRGSLHLAARGTLTLDTAAQKTLLFKEVHDSSVVHDLSLKGHPGLIQVAAYLAADAPAVGPQKLRPSQVGPLSLLPIGAPEQYR